MPEFMCLPIQSHETVRGNFSASVQCTLRCKSCLLFWYSSFSGQDGRTFKAAKYSLLPTFFPSSAHTRYLQMRTFLAHLGLGGSGPFLNSCSSPICTKAERETAGERQPFIHLVCCCPPRKEKGAHLRMLISGGSVAAIKDERKINDITLLWLCRRHRRDTPASGK